MKMNAMTTVFKTFATIAFKEFFVFISKMTKGFINEHSFDKLFFGFRTQVID